MKDLSSPTAQEIIDLAHPPEGLETTLHLRDVGERLAQKFYALEEEEGGIKSVLMDDLDVYFEQLQRLRETSQKDPKDVEQDLFQLSHTWGMRCANQKELFLYEVGVTPLITLNQNSAYFLHEIYTDAIREQVDTLCDHLYGEIFSRLPQYDHKQLRLRNELSIASCITLIGPEKYATVFAGHTYDRTGIDVIELSPVAQRALTSIEIIRDLGSVGYSNGLRSILHHEYLHKTHGGVSTANRSRACLREAHAYIGSGRYSRMYRSSTLVNAMENDPLYTQYGRGESFNRDRFLLDIVGIKKIYALGESDEQIGVLIQEIPLLNSLENRIQEILEEKGYSDSDLDALLLIDDFKRMVYVRQVKQIAQEVLNNTINKTNA